jgi:hypothetical protein
MTTLAAHLTAVCAAYGITPLREPVPLQQGYVAYVHRVDLVDGSAVFTKTYDDARPITAMIMPTLAAITTATQTLATVPAVAGRIVAPLPGLLVRSGPYTSVVFPYIDGITPRETPLTAPQLTALVTTVARIHAVDTTLPGLSSVPVEDFSAVWVDDVVPALQEAAHPGHPLTALIAPLLSTLSERYAQFLQLAGELRARHHPLVVCHTDIHGYNVVIADDVPLLIDWEGMKIAPPEHDLMFWVDDERWESIWEVYRAVHPAATIDPERLTFYRLRRLFEDLVQDVQRVTQEHPTPEQMIDLADSVAQISQTLAAWEN